MSKLILLLALCTQAEERSRRAVVELPTNGIPVIAGKAEPWKDLPAALKRHAGAGIRQLVLRVDGSVPFSSVQRLMAAAREAGIEGVEFSSDKPAAPVRFSDEARRSLRVKLRDGPKGLEILLLQESTAVSLDDLRRKLKGMEKGPVVVDADFEVPYGAVREIVSACTEEGFVRVSFAGAARKAGAIRVLYAEESPGWEYRYLRNAMEREAAVRLDVHLAAAEPDFPRVLREFPADLSGYHVVLMGSLKKLDAGRRKALAEFVHQGGGVVWMAPDVNPPDWIGHDLDGICPVRLGGGKLARKPTETWGVRDASSPLARVIEWKTLPPEHVLEMEVANVDPDARVVVEPIPVGDPSLREALRRRENEDRKSRGIPLLEREGENPLLVTQAVGKGRSVFVSVLNTHAWRERVGDQPTFAPFWTGVLKWAAGH